MEQKENFGPVNCLADRREFLDVKLSHLLDKINELNPQTFGDVGNSYGDDFTLQFRFGEGNKEMKTAAFSGMET
jgi:hypothetical protein